MKMEKHRHFCNRTLTRCFVSINSTAVGTPETPNREGTLYDRGGKIEG